VAPFDPHLPLAIFCRLAGVPCKLPLYKFVEKQNSVQAVVADMQPGGKTAAGHIAMRVRVY
jgi:Tfp pilus assembly major pilin PilA